MDILDEMVGNDSQPTLDSMFSMERSWVKPPRDALRNRAATTALLTENPESAVDNYRLMMQEGDQGQDVLGEQLRTNILSNTHQIDMKGVMDVLADPTIPLDQKQDAIKSLKDSTMLKDQGNTLFTNGLTRGSNGETVEAEDARLSSVDAIRDIYNTRQEIQGLVNAHAASLNGGVDAKSFAELLELYVMPFGNSINASTLSKNVNDTGFWKAIKDGILPGSATANLRANLENIPPEKRVEFAKKLVDVISKNSGIVFSNDNQFAQYDKATSIFEEGGYGSTQEFLDNVSPLLDVIGVGQAFRGASKMFKATKAANIAGEALAADLGKAATGTFADKLREDRIAKQMKATEALDNPTPTVPPKSSPTLSGSFDYSAERAKIGVPDAATAQKQSQIDDLINQRAELLGNSSGLAERGNVRNIEAELKALEQPNVDVKARAKEIQASNKVSYKEASKQANKEADALNADYEAKRTRLEDSLDANRQAASNEQRLAELDKKIEALQKNVPTLAGSKLNPIADMIQRIDHNSFARREMPSSPAAIIQQSNPEHARAVHSVVVKSTTDEVAEGLYGVGKNDAVASDVYPQVVTESGAVRSKIIDIERNLRQELQVDPELVDLVNNSGATYYTQAEKAKARANIVNQFSHAEGMTINEAMSSFKLDGGRVVASAVYGTPEGAFSNAVDAFRQAKLALRNYGVLDSEITVLRKEGLDHVPIGLNDHVPDGPGNYLVKVDTVHEFDPTDFSNLESFNVKRNLFDRIPQLVSKSQGSLTRNLFDAASTLHPIYTGAASVASDATAKFDKFMLTLADEYAKKFVNLPKDRQAKVNDYIKEANYNGIAFDKTDLLARGFNADEIDAISSWRKFWDGHFYLENYDVVRTLNSQGYELFKNSNTELYAKPIAKNQNLGRVYDPATDSVIIHSKADGDALYNAGGTYARLRRPADIGGQTVEHMIVRNTATEYTRKFRDSDKVLNYREGYFQLQYKAPKFVDEIKSDGTVRTVAVAGDTVEASHFAERMNKTTGLQYRVRGDERGLRRGDDSWWDVNSASGRIAQRYRGKLLEDASGLNHLGDSSYIINPVDSAVRAAKSIAGRTVNRPMLEASKARFMNQYERFLPSDGIGGKRYPASVKEIGAKGEFTTKEIADARTTYEYINYLENGYINAADEVFKAGLNGIADMLGSRGHASLERGANLLGEGAPVSLAKNSVFMAYIGSNFLRQLIVQPHQVVRTFSYNPIGWVKGTIPKLIGEYTAEKMGLGNKSAFTKFVDESGLLDAVDKSNLVRGTLTDAADSTNKVVRAASNVVNIPRKIGFDLGEQANLLGHAGAVYDRYVRRGEDMADKAVRDRAYSEVRAISYDMNFAGDMPYNQTTPAMILQFMQVPHKAFLQLTNRRIDTATRARLITGDLILWGPPTLLISDLLGADVLPDNPKLREAFTWGAESALINAALTKQFGESTDIDFSSLAPYDMTGWSKFFTAMYSGGLHDALMNSPAGQLFFKDGSRFQMAVSSMGRYFGAIEDDKEDPETFLSVMNEVAKMSSGYSNAVKAKLMLDAQKKLDQYGNTIDDKVSKVEAWAQLFGFGTSDTRDLYRISQEMNKDLKSHKDDVTKVYEDIKRYYAEKLDVETTDPKYITKVTGRILSTFKDDPAAQAIIAQKLAQDLAGKDSQLLATFMRRSGIPNLGGLRDQVKQMPVSDAQKDLMLKRIDDMEKARNQLKETK